MIDFIQQGGAYTLLLGYDYTKNEPKCQVPVSYEEAVQIAANFSEEFAVAIGKKEMEWSFGAFKLTDAPDFPLGWTDPRARTKLYYENKCWHMIPPEIELIGKLAKSVLDSNE
jgi:hypothetical protein